MRYLFLVLGIHCVLGSGGTKAACPLTIGSPAPELKVDTWVKGDPVRGIEKGRVYVIEFWGTTCGPCIRCLPHLTDLQQQHKAVLFVSLSDEPERTIRDKDQNQVEQRIRSDYVLAHAFAGKGNLVKAMEHAECALRSCRKARSSASANEEGFGQQLENWAKTLEADSMAFKKKVGAAHEK